MSEFNYKEYLSGIEIRKGDVVDIVSDLVSFMVYCRERKLKFDANHLIDSLEELVGSEGTILIRTFTWAFCRGEPFDILNTPSEAGSLGTIAMKRHDFSRTRHPIYSWSVWGKDAECLCKLNNVKSFGEKTPFEYLCENDAKLLTFGNTQVSGVTVQHHFEQLAHVPYRAEKVFESEYIDENGSRSVKRYSMFVRPSNINVENLGDEWWVNLVNEKNVGRKICYDGALSGRACNYKEIGKYMTEEIVGNFSRKIMRVNGVMGYDNPKFDLSMARYYS